MTILSPGGRGAAGGPSDHELLARIDRYQNALPRQNGHAEEFGPLTLFVRDGAGRPLHARPDAGRQVTAADVERVRARQRELGVPESFEWVEESAPSMRAAAEQAGLAVQRRPLLVLPDDATAATDRRLPPGVSVMTLTADDPELATAVVTPHLAFADIGTHVGAAGTGELTEAVGRHAADIASMADRVRAGRATFVAAVEDGVALCSGMLPGVAEGVTEVCGVGTLPAARRRGLGLAVTARLVAEARSLGVRTVFICATDESVARIYRRAGFREIATFLEAEPATA